MPGSGLGLAIVKQAAEIGGGSVRAQNAPGGGALRWRSASDPRSPLLPRPREPRGLLAVGS